VYATVTLMSGRVKVLRQRKLLTVKFWNYFKNISYFCATSHQWLCSVL